MHQTRRCVVCVGSFRLPLNSTLVVIFLKQCFLWTTSRHPIFQRFHPSVVTKEIPTLLAHHQSEPTAPLRVRATSIHSTIKHPHKATPCAPLASPSPPSASSSSAHPSPSSTANDPSPPTHTSTHVASPSPYPS